MKNKKGMRVVALLTASVMLSGCKANTNETAKQTAQPVESSEQKSMQAGDSAVAQSESTEQETDDKVTVANPVNNNFAWQEISITFPDTWNDSYVITQDQSGFSVYQKASYEKEKGMGFLFGIGRQKDWSNELAGEKLIAYTDKGTLYYLYQPTDVPCDTDNEQVVKQYGDMMEDVSRIVSDVSIDTAGIQYNGDEYKIPVSSIATLKKDQLSNLSDNDLWIARNEIYARHGRGFKSEYLQNYFNTCSWYEKSKEADSFSDNSLSQLERDNLKLIAAVEQDYGTAHPYPKEYQTGTAVYETLSDTHGRNEITYDVKEKEYNDYSYQLTIDDVAYDLSKYITMANPITDVFYVTDIADYDNLLEIAVLDLGPSDDPTTHFFQYDGSLSYIGSVDGFPFKEHNNGIDGFVEQNLIVGTTRMDLIETSYLDGDWWYDSEKRSIDYREDGDWHNYQSWPAHELYLDLPVYREPDEKSKTIVMPAQKQVYFISSDMKEWIFVRAKDGSKGYIRVSDGKIQNVGKAAEEVFSNLNYFD